MDVLIAWLCAIGGGALLLAGVTSVWSWANQLLNWKWSVTRFEAKKAEIAEHNEANPDKQIRKPGKPRWRRARSQQIAVLRYGYPWGLALLTAMGYLAYRGFDLKIYTAFAICWFLLTRIRFQHEVYATVKHNKLVHKDGQVIAHQLFKHTAQQLIRHHYTWAFSQPSFVGEAKQRQKKVYWYFGPKILRAPVNLLCSMVMAIVHFGWLRMLFHVRLVLPLLVYGGVSFVWPLWGAITVLHNCSEIVDKRNDTYEPGYDVWWAWFTPEPEWPKTATANAAQPPAESDGSAVPAKG